jgi:ribonuclease/clavin/mitogillin
VANIKSVSVVLQHQDSIIMSKRRFDLKAFPGYDAFVGGRVEKTDANSQAAAFREVQEELGIDLQEQGLVDSITSLGVFHTPKGFTRRFRNETLWIKLTAMPEITVDTNELIDAGWYKLTELMQKFKAGELLVVPAVKVIFQALAQNQDPQIAINDLAKKLEDDFYPIDFVDELYMICVPSNTIPPAEHTNCFFMDDLLVDPSPKDADTCNKLLKYLENFNIQRIMLTHHHPDHRQFASHIARSLAVPMLMSDFCHKEIIKEEGVQYFENVQVKIIEDQDTLCHWKGEAVQAIHVPGHDEGQMALMPVSKKWMIVGDLIQGIGTVVIAAPEGDMAKYFSSLERCLELDPKVIIPSHGEALGSTHYLSVTLEHRKLREEQVAKAKSEGKTIEEMLDLIYPKLDERLKPLAVENIKSHLRKIN